MQNDDFTDDEGRKNNWLPPEGWKAVEVVKMVSATSKAGNSKYTVDLVSTVDASDGIQIDLTNIPGKRWLLRQLIEACGVEPRIEADADGKDHKKYDWEVEDVEGKTVMAKCVHEPNDWTDRQNVQHHDHRAKFVEFKKLTTNPRD